MTLGKGCICGWHRTVSEGRRLSSPVRPKTASSVSWGYYRRHRTIPSRRKSQRWCLAKRVRNRYLFQLSNSNSNFTYFDKIWWWFRTPAERLPLTPPFALVPSSTASISSRSQSKKTAKRTLPCQFHSRARSRTSFIFITGERHPHKTFTPSF